MKIYTFKVHITVDGFLEVDVKAESEEKARGIIDYQIEGWQISEMAVCDTAGAKLISAVELDSETEDGD